MHRVQHRDARCLKAVRVLDLHSLLNSLHWSRAGLDELCMCLKMCPGVCSLNLGEMLTCPRGGVDCVIQTIELGLTGLAMDGICPGYSPRLCPCPSLHSGSEKQQSPHAAHVA